MQPNSTTSTAGATPVVETPATGTVPALVGATPTMTLDEALKALADKDHQLANATEERDRHRKKLTTFEQAQSDAEKAKLSDLERTQKEMQTIAAKADAYRKQLADQEIRIEALKMHFRDPADAIGQLSGKLEIDDETGLPKDLTKHLKALADAKPYLLEGDPPRVPLSSGSASNPARASTTATFTRESIKAMTPAEREAKLPEIKDWMSKQR